MKGGVRQKHLRAASARQRARRSAAASTCRTCASARAVLLGSLDALPDVMRLLNRTRDPSDAFSLLRPYERPTALPPPDGPYDYLPIAVGARRSRGRRRPRFLVRAPAPPRNVTFSDDDAVVFFTSWSNSFTEIFSRAVVRAAQFWRNSGAMRTQSADDSILRRCASSSCGAARPAAAAASTCGPPCGARIGVPTTRTSGSSRSRRTRCSHSRRRRRARWSSRSGGRWRRMTTTLPTPTSRVQCSRHGSHHTASRARASATSLRCRSRTRRGRGRPCRPSLRTTPLLTTRCAPPSAMAPSCPRIRRRRRRRRSLRVRCGRGGVAPRGRTVWSTAWRRRAVGQRFTRAAAVGVRGGREHGR